jgi:hypothetical protein
MHARSGSGLDAQTDARTLGYCNCQLQRPNIPVACVGIHGHPPPPTVTVANVLNALLGPLSNPTGIDRPEGGLKTQSPHTPHGMLSLCSLRSQGPSALARSPHSHASLPASPAVLASLAASPLLLSLAYASLAPLAAYLLVLHSVSPPLPPAPCSLRSLPLLLPSLCLGRL